jgi:hypothetical protein
MLRRASPAGWYRCTAEPSCGEAAEPARIDEPCGGSLLPEPPGSGRSLDDDDRATTETWSTTDPPDETES